jgi:hypothetical protein
MVSYGAGTQWKSVFLSTHHPFIHPSLTVGWYPVGSKNSGPYCYSQPLFSWANSFCIVVTKKIGNYFFECINSRKIINFWGIIHQNLETTKFYQKINFKKKN